MYFVILVLSHILFLMSAEARGNGLLESKIIGGQPINIAQAPYMAVFTINNRSLSCGAAIIGRRYLLTAGHCLTTIPVIDPKVKVGSTFIKNFTKVYSVTKWFVHPEYDSEGGNNDVGVLIINETLKWTRSVAPIALAKENFIVPVGALVSVKGWGFTNSTIQSVSDQLREVEIPVVSQQDCSEAYERVNVTITENEICAGVAGKDSCTGDSGGPLTYKKRLVGLVSFGEGCAVEGFPGVNTKVSAMRPWIDEILFENYFCGWS